MVPKEECTDKDLRADSLNI